jgi:predicted amidohydrolase
MRWTIEENTAVILSAIHLAADKRARLCVFPELGITGFHRKIASQATPTGVEAALNAIQAACAARRVAVAVGAPSFCEDGKIFNSHIHINELGTVVATSPKNGLTPSEATFFAAGVTRPVSTLGGLKCASALCREIEDLESLAGQLPTGRTDIIFWPSLVGRPPTSPPDPDEVKYLPLAQALAVQSDAYVVQSNWPNSLNYPEEGTHAGESVVVAPTGEVLLTLPRAQAGVAVFELGERSYEWFPEGQ